MRVESVHNIYRSDPQGIRVIQWTTKEANGRHYVQSNAYTIHLYSKEGRLEEYTNKQQVDVMA